MLEWRQARDQNVARKIFEKGLELPHFLTNVDYLMEYLDFLYGEPEILEIY